MQRCGGEGADIRQRIFDERLCRPLAHALGALLHTVADAGLLIADPERERAEEHIALGQAVERVDDLAVKELEVRRGGHVHPRGLADEPIEAVGGKLVQPAFLAAVLLDALDDLIALLPEPVHFDYLLRRVLKVAVDDDAAVALRLLQPREHRGFLAEVAAEVYADDVVVLPGGLVYLRPCVVTGAVVNEQQLIVDLLRLENFRHALRRLGDHFFLIIGRQDHGKHFSHLTWKSDMSRSDRSGTAAPPCHNRRRLRARR